MARITRIKEICFSLYPFYYRSESTRPAQKQPGQFVILAYGYGLNETSFNP
jgi:hypothetical protein